MRRILFLVIVVAAPVLTTHGAAATAKPPQLVAWAVYWRSPLVGMSRVGYGGPLVRRLPPGRYRIQVEAVANFSFRIHGPGADRRTGFGAAEGRPYFHAWNVRFRKTCASGRGSIATGPRESRRHSSREAASRFSGSSRCGRRRRAPTRRWLTARAEKGFRAGGSARREHPRLLGEVLER